MVRLSWCHGQRLSLESAADQYLIKHTKRREQKAQILYFQKLQENKLESSHPEIKRFRMQTFLSIIQFSMHVIFILALSVGNFMSGAYKVQPLRVGVFDIFQL